MSECSNCTNIAAQNCDNRQCGSCCPGCSHHGWDGDNSFSAAIIINNITEEQGDAAVRAAVDAVEELRDDDGGQPRHDGRARVDRTDRILAPTTEQQLLGGGDSCNSCNNIAAQNCDNGQCGSCCPGCSHH